MQLGRAVGCAACDGCAGQHAVDGGSDSRGGVGHTGQGVDLRRGRCACASGGIATEGVQCGGVCGHPCIDSGLQIHQRAHATAVVRSVCNRGQNGSQVLVGHTGQAQCRQLGHGQGRRSRASGGGGQQPVDQIGQGIEVGQGAHLGRCLGAHHIVEQAQTVGVGGAQAQVYTHRLIVRSRRIGAGRICCAAIGLAQNFGVGVQDHLQLFFGVNHRPGDGRIGQHAVQGCGEFWRHAHQAKGRVLLLGWGGHGRVVDDAVIVGIGLNQQGRTQ